jgi:HAMP domain-containing protein
VTTAPPPDETAPLVGASRSSPLRRVIDPRRWSLGARLGVTLVLATLVPMALVSVMATRTGQGAVEASELGAAEGAATVGAAAVDEYLNGVAARADQLGTNPTVVEFLADGGSAPSLGDAPDVVATLVADSKGTIVAGPTDQLGTSVTTEPWFVQAVAGKPAIGELTATGGRSFVTVAAPARRPGAAVVGVAALQVSGDDLLFALNQAPLGPGGQAILVDDAGTVITARDGRLQGRTLDELGMTTVATEISSEPKGSVARTALSGRGDQVAAWATTAGAATAIVTQPRRAFMAPIDRLVNTITIALLVVGILAVIGALLVASRLSRPIGALTRAARAVEDGAPPDDDELQRIGRSHDDIGRLARVFARMAEQVAVRERRLKEQVRSLKVEVDQERRRKEVQEVTDSDFFRDLEGRAAEMRRRAKGNG